ncbi:helix-turn-helix transcriptional regulator [Candidatus Nitrotoga arctica]|uniref:helix-turn-helix transcriptional regulator n=1 Tax=Candidatus Nitrotoga arctica TaxID=453162 RepID=UPI001EFC09D9|nr:AlpA family phage regulatory protein [Candidatus Nitrotoga arctica]
MQTKQTPQPPAYLRLADMRTRYRVSGSTIWNWCKTNGLPSPHKLGANTTVWKLADLLQWEASRTSAK